MNTYRFEQESSKLKEIINLEFDLAIMEPSRERRYVDSRMVYSLVLKNRGYSYTEIGKSINKTHSTILYYLRDISVVFKQCPELNKVYNRVSVSHNVKYDPVYDMDSVELRSHIYELRDSLDALSLQLKKVKSDLAVCENNEGRLSKIFYTLKTRLPKGKEEKLQSKLITLINGL